MLAAAQQCNQQHIVITLGPALTEISSLNRFPHKKSKLQP